MANKIPRALRSARRNAIEIPSGLKSIRGNAIRNNLRKIFLKLKPVADVGRVNSRLNCSNTQEAIPVWAGTYEDKAVARAQGFKADDIRFGRSNRSKVYAETVTDRNWKIHDRDWTKGFSEKEKDEYGPANAYGPRAGCMHQLYIAIRIKEGTHYRHVGTITVGFRNKPNRGKVDRIMKRWANEGAGLDYVKYLKKTFNLGGPVF
ncbi:MAG: hypothetical protein ACREP5_13680 [Candidatus Binatia bacterium]